MADKKIKIEVDLDAEPSIAQLKKLKLALKEKKPHLGKEKRNQKNY